MKKLVDLYVLYLRYAGKKNIDFSTAKSDLNLCRTFVKKYAIGTKEKRKAMYNRNFDSVVDMLDALQEVN